MIPKLNIYLIFTYRLINYFFFVSIIYVLKPINQLLVKKGLYNENIYTIITRIRRKKRHHI